MNTMTSSHGRITTQCHRNPRAGTTMTSAVVRFSRILLASFLLTSSVHCMHFVPHEGDEFDWRNDGVIAPVSDSRPIGDSAPYVTAEAVESLLALETEQPLVILSRQQVAECCEEWPALTHGYSCITMIGGLCAAPAYRSTEEICNTSTCLPVVKEISTVYLPPNREDKMVEAVLKTPLSAALDVSPESFTNYVGGIYSEVNCSTAQADHLVQIVGYGTTTDAQPYWIVQNSWGVDWGDAGYMRIVRGQNMCGIESHVFYPVLNQ